MEILGKSKYSVCPHLFNLKMLLNCGMAAPKEFDPEKNCKEIDPKSVSHASLRVTTYCGLKEDAIKYEFVTCTHLARFSLAFASDWKIKLKRTVLRKTLEILTHIL